MTKTVSITRRLEFDAGHRIPGHAGQCRNLLRTDTPEFGHLREELHAGHRADAGQ